MYQIMFNDPEVKQLAPNDISLVKVAEFPKLALKTWCIT